MEEDFYDGNNYLTLAESLAALGDDEGFYINFEKGLRFGGDPEYMFDEIKEKYMDEERYQNLVEKYAVPSSL